MAIIPSIGIVGNKPAATQTSAEDYGGLPDDLGRDAVYFNCTACHSLKQFTQQRLPREEWDTLLDWMVEKNGMHPMEPWARTLVLNYLATHFGLEEDGWQGLPALDPENRDLVLDYLATYYGRK